MRESTTEIMRCMIFLYAIVLHHLPGVIFWTTVLDDTEASYHLHGRIYTTHVACGSFDTICTY